MLKGLFLVAAFLAPIKILIGGVNFTPHDAVILLLAPLVLLGRRPIVVPPGHVLAGAWILVLAAIASTLRSPDPGQSLLQIAQLVFVFVVQLPVVLTLVDSRRMAWRSVALLTLGLVVYWAAAYLAGNVSGAGRAQTAGGDSPNRLGYGVAFALPFLIVLFQRAYRHSRIWLLVPPIVVATVGIVGLTFWVLAAGGSRGATLAAFVALLTFFAWRNGLSWAGLRRVAIVAVTVPLLGYGWFVSTVPPQVLRDRIQRTLDAQHPYAWDRYELAVAGLRAFADSPLLGVGLGNFRYVIHEYSMVAGSSDPHNVWVQLLSTTGLFGALAFAALIGGWYLTLFQASMAPGAPAHDRRLAWAFVASMTAMMTILMFIPMVLDRMFWLAYGLGLALARTTAVPRAARVPAPWVDAADPGRRLA